MTEYYFVYALAKQILPSKLLEKSCGWPQHAKPNQISAPLWVDEELFRQNHPDISLLEMDCVKCVLLSISGLSREAYDDKIKSNPDLNHAPRKRLEGDTDLDLATHFAKKSFWTIDEALAFVIGLTPETDLGYAIEGVAKIHPKTPMFKFYVETKALLLSAITANEVLLVPNTKNSFSGNLLRPVSFIKWSEKYDIPLPQTLRKLTLKFQDGDIKEPKPNSMNPKTKSSMLQLIHAFGQLRAIGYNPEKPNNLALDRIETALEDCKLSISKKTIRTYMRDAYAEYERQMDKKQ